MLGRVASRSGSACVSIEPPIAGAIDKPWYEFAWPTLSRFGSRTPGCAQCLVSAPRGACTGAGRATANSRSWHFGTAFRGMAHENPSLDPAPATSLWGCLWGAFLHSHYEPPLAITTLSSATTGGYRVSIFSSAVLPNRSWHRASPAPRRLLARLLHCLRLRRSSVSQSAASLAAVATRQGHCG